MLIQILLFLPSTLYRTGADPCWIRVPMQSRNHICIHSRLWQEALKSSNFSLEKRVTIARSKFSAPPHNYGSHIPKSVILTQHAASLEDFFREEDSFREHPLRKKLLMAEYLPESLEPRISIWPWMERVRERTSVLLRPVDSLGILRKITLNESLGENALNNPLPLLRILGFVHLTTVSGIHLSIIGSLFHLGFRQLCAALRVSPKIGFHMGCLASNGLVFLIWILGGSRPGMLRPWMILLMHDLAKAWGIRWTRGIPLMLVVGLEYLLEKFQEFPAPGQQMNSGRWIYTLAVGGGLFWAKSLQSIHLSLALGSWLSVAIWEAWETGLLAVGTPLFSLITLPLFCWLIFPSTLLAILLNELGLEPLALLLSQVVGTWSFWSISMLLGLALRPGNLWILPQWALLTGALTSAILISLLLIKEKANYSKSSKADEQLSISRLKNIFCPLLFFTVLLLGWRYWKDSHPMLGSARAQSVEQLDVGQGDAALIKEASTKVVLSPQSSAHFATAGLIDTGAEKALKDSDWIQLLARRQISELDWVALTHLDEDHAGGYLKLSKLIPIRCVRTSRRELGSKQGRSWLKQLQNQGLSVSDLRIADWQASKQAQPCLPYPSFEVPSPAHNKRRKSKKSPNQNMGAIFIPLESGGFYLSAGDAGSKDELKIARWAARLASSLDQSSRISSRALKDPRILKVSHHGSKNSSSSEVLRILKPSEAWISSGLGNRYSHPHEATLSRLKQVGALIRRTDQDGSILYQIEQRCQLPGN